MAVWLSRVAEDRRAHSGRILLMAAPLSVTPLVIVGSGGLGREVLEIVRDINAVRPTFDVLGFLDDDPADAALVERLGSRILGTSAALAELAATVIIAIASPTSRRRIDARVGALGLRAERLVHPWASVGSSVVMEEGVIVGAEVGAGAIVVRDVAAETIVAGPAGRPTLRGALNGGERSIE